MLLVCTHEYILQKIMILILSVLQLTHSFTEQVETDGDLRRQQTTAAWEAAEAEMLDRTTALHELMRQAGENASAASAQAAEDAAEEEAEMLRRRREAIGLQASSASGSSSSKLEAPRLRVNGLPPRVGTGSTPFDGLHSPLVAAAADLVVPGVMQLSSPTATDDDEINRAEISKSVLEHLGRNLGRKEHSAYNEMCPVFGALAAAQGSLCEALVSWAATDEAGTMTRPRPDSETRAQAAISEFLLSRAAAVAPPKVTGDEC